MLKTTFVTYIANFCDDLVGTGGVLGGKYSKLLRQGFYKKNKKK